MERLPGSRWRKETKEVLASKAVDHLIDSIREQIPEGEREGNPYWEMTHEKRNIILRSKDQLKIDTMLGRTTPERVRKMAAENIISVLNNQPPETYVPSDEDKVYAGMIAVVNKMDGRTTPGWLVKLAGEMWKKRG